MHRTKLQLPHNVRGGSNKINSESRVTRGWGVGACLQFSWKECESPNLGPCDPITNDCGQEAIYLSPPQTKL
jgi:hypothetical protein